MSWVKGIEVLAWEMGIALEVGIAVPVVKNSFFVYLLYCVFILTLLSL